MIKLGHKVAGNDNMIGGDSDNVPLEAEWSIIDCCDTEDLKDAMAGSEVVYHCAATAYEGLSVFSPATVTRNIVQASVSVFSAAIANKVKRIVHCSSMARYGKGNPPFKEEDPTMPEDPYGIGKVAAEQFLRNLCETHGVEYVIAVPHNIIGPRQKYDDPYRNVASIMINRCLQGRPPIIYGDGTQVRCFSYVDDCLSCLVKMGFDPDVVGEVINIGPDENPISINHLAEIVSNQTGYNGGPMYVKARPQEVSVAVCSSNKARKLLNYSTKTNIIEGIAHMVNYIRRRKPRPFQYHLPIEIVNEKTPKTWLNRLF